MSNEKINLTGGRRLARNVVWNLIGNGAPLLVAIISIPILINSLGTERFGVLTLVWMVVGYFSLFDLGLGRALTQLVADRLGAGNLKDIPPLVWTTMALMAVFSIVGAIILATISPWLIGKLLKIPEQLYEETLVSFYLLTISIPIVVSTTGLRGILEAYQRFGLVNVIRVPLGVFTFLGPLIVLPFSHSLVPVVAVLLIGRLLAWWVHLVFCFRVEPSLRNSIKVRKDMVRPLLNFGGWMSVSNIVGPIMVYMDRFLIGAIISMSAVAYYATPFEVVSKLRMIPGALVGVLFPAISATYKSDPKRTARLLGRGFSFIWVTLFPLVLIIVTFAHEGMEIWLGKEFADNSSQVVQWLAVGMFINGFAQVAFALVQGVGRPDITAKLHLIELPFYLLSLWWLIGVYGIVGVAIAWVGRVIVDKLLLLGIARWSLRVDMEYMGRITAMFGLAMLALLLGGGLITMLSTKIIFVLLVLGILFPIVAFYLLASKEQQSITAALTFLSGLKNRMKSN